MVRDAAQCNATRRDGARCSSGIVLPSGFCAMHDPGRQADVARMRQAGGRGKATSVRAAKMLPAQLRPVFDLILTALDETHAGTLDPKVANALAALAGAACRLLTAGELEQRLRELETRLSA